MDPDMRRALRSQIRIIRSFAAYGEERLPEAIAELRAADEGPCISCLLPYLAFMYDHAGNADSAIAVFERYLATKELARVALDANFLALTHKRLGELYDARGDRERAAAHFSAFIDLWRDADPDLRPRVEDAKRRLQILRQGQG
jgi:tetratricopeptide (TPR) repeat protein